MDVPEPKEYLSLTEFFIPKKLIPGQDEWRPETTDFYIKFKDDELVSKSSSFLQISFGVLYLFEVLHRETCAYKLL